MDPLLQQIIDAQRLIDWRSPGQEALMPWGGEMVRAYGGFQLPRELAQSVMAANPNLQGSWVATDPEGGGYTDPSLYIPEPLAQEWKNLPGRAAFESGPLGFREVAGKGGIGPVSNDMHHSKWDADYGWVIPAAPLALAAAGVAAPWAGALEGAAAPAFEFGAGGPMGWEALPETGGMVGSGINPATANLGLKAAPSPLTGLEQLHAGGLGAGMASGTSGLGMGGTGAGLGGAGLLNAGNALGAGLLNAGQYIPTGAMAEAIAGAGGGLPSGAVSAAAGGGSYFPKWAQGGKSLLDGAKTALSGLQALSGASGLLGGGQGGQSAPSGILGGSGTPKGAAYQPPNYSLLPNVPIGDGGAQLRLLGQQGLLGFRGY